MRYLRGKILQNYWKAFVQIFKKSLKQRSKNPYVQPGQYYCWYNQESTQYFQSNSGK
jgi:hypothetical protein